MVATDEDGHADSVEFSITVTDVAEDPVISTRPGSGLTYQSLDYQENRTSAVYRYRASDPQGGNIEWSVTGSDRDSFTMDERGNLTFDSSPDFEARGDSDRNNRYAITVVATDEQGLSDSLDVVISVTNVNEGPEVSGTDTFNIDENQGLGQATYTATDPEGDTVTRWSLAGRDGGDFTINETGVMTLEHSGLRAAGRLQPRQHVRSNGAAV